jgi:hypothetical protein
MKRRQLGLGLDSSSCCWPTCVITCTSLGKWYYLIAALQTIAPKIGEEVLGVLQSPQLPPTESILTALLNEITTVLDNFILVLDDYHVIDAKPVDHALAFLLEHLPPQMHLVIVTREDPQLPLARLRGLGQMKNPEASLGVSNYQSSNSRGCCWCNCRYSPPP